jgi:hypothetical protein
MLRVGIYLRWSPSARTAFAIAFGDTLTHRFFYEYLLDRVKSKQNIDVPELIKESTTAANEDIARYLRDGTVWYEWGGFRKSLLGVGHFIWYCLSYGIFYGIAGAIGTSMRSTF